MIICLCHRVSDRDIGREVRAGCPSFEALQDDLRVGTACGACLDDARMAYEDHHHAACGMDDGGLHVTRVLGAGAAIPV